MCVDILISSATMSSFSRERLMMTTSSPRLASCRGRGMHTVPPPSAAVPPVHSLGQCLLKLPSQLESTRDDSGSYTATCNSPAHLPYFLRLVREIPRGAKKYARKPPASLCSRLNATLDRYSAPTTAAMFLHVDGRRSTTVECR